MNLKKVFIWINTFLSMIGATSLVFLAIVALTAADYLEAGTVALIVGIMVGMYEAIQQEVSGR